VEEMMGIMRDAFDHGVLKGRVQVRLLLVVYDWTKFVFGGSDELKDAVKEGFVARVKDLNRNRSFELCLSMSNDIHAQPRVIAFITVTVVMK
jgi:hypothetical protein